MTPDLHAAATQLAADLATLHRAGRIASVWRAGMLGSDGSRVLAVHYDGTITTDDLWNASAGYEPDIRHCRGTPHPMYPVPDLSDEATVDGVVRLAREAWGDPGIHLAPARWAHDAPEPYAGTIRHWHCYSSRRYYPETETVCSVVGATEALAACAAIRAAAAGVGT